MKKTAKLLTAVLLAALVCSMAVIPGRAATSYTYTVTISNGGLSETYYNSNEFGMYNVSMNDGRMVISGIPYNTVLDLSNAVNVSPFNEYDLRGYVRAGRDYDEAVFTIRVTGDTDIVAAYALPGQQVAYTVRFVDEEERSLAPDKTFYGTIGDKPVANYVYVEGYIPNAYNLTGTLSDDPNNNIFTFVYEKAVNETEDIDLGVIDYGTGNTNNTNNTNNTTGNTGNTGNTGTPAQPSITDSANTNANTNTNANANAPAAQNDSAQNGDADVPAENAVTVEAPQEIIDLDDINPPEEKGTNIIDEIVRDETSRKGAIIGGSLALVAAALCVSTAVLMKKRYDYDDYDEDGEDNDEDDEDDEDDEAEEET